jgi:hypothetical protein
MDSTIEITSRFRAMLRRIGTLQGPYVGVPLAPGEVPFVARRELIAQVVRNLVDIKATFVDDGDTTYLQIEGRTAIGRHISKVRNLQNTLNERQIEREAYRWAKNCRDALKKATRKGVVFDKAAREVRKIEVKRRKVDEQIQKLERKVNDRRSSRPVNPLLVPKREVSGDYARRSYARLYAERSKRRAISKLATRHAGHWETREPSKAAVAAALVANAKPSLFGGVPEPMEISRAEKVWKHFAWKPYYAGLEVRGIRVPYTYDQLKGRVRGPENPEDYCRQMRFIGLADRKTTCGSWADSREESQKEMARHADARKEYLAEQREIRSLRLTIESLRELRASHEAELTRLESGSSDEEELAV